MGRGLCSLDCFRRQYLKEFFLVNVTYYCLYSTKTFSRALIANKEQALLSKELALLRSDLPHYLVPFSTGDLVFRKPDKHDMKIKVTA
ncbi:hypothetical protein L1987_00345 [Smallanthus sonchifolius]|uniref:Uncharacterized protein n=1 Tax=Smallanthus sonchifolius TaxID=185202 RepID=A0ACB9K201_9ASTR|nr:hypothetical protein L1987_00345 [Smallanthus sonchifolius]